MASESCNRLLARHTVVFSLLSGARSQMAGAPQTSAGAEQLHSSRLTAFLTIDCMHHQASLAKRPSLLSINGGGVAAILIRLGHLCQSSLFRRRVEASLESWVRRCLTVETVLDLPPESHGWLQHNQRLLALCDHGMSSEAKSNLLSLCNHCWLAPRLTHWCRIGCCNNRADSVGKVLSCLRASFCGWLEIPLLYRWKHTEAALSYCLRNLSLHNMLYTVLEAALAGDGNLAPSPDTAATDFDSDVPYSIRQVVRGRKALEFFKQKQASALFCPQQLCHCAAH